MTTANLTQKTWLDYLSDEDLAFIKRFVLCSGSLKELAGEYGISYPTIRLRLDRLIAKIRVVEEHQDVSPFEPLLAHNMRKERSPTTPSSDYWLPTVKSWRKAMRPSVVALIVLWVVVSTACAQDVAKGPLPAESKTASGSGNIAARQERPEVANPPGQPEHGWWSDRTAGWIGGVGGTTVGLLGGLIGTLGGLGKARHFVLTLNACLVGFGVVCLVSGVIALALGQPYAVYYPLLLGGIILTAVCGGIRPALRQGYEQRELRRMARWMLAS